MKSEQWSRIQELFFAALEMTSEEQDRFLASACDGDAALRQQVEALLESDERGTMRIESAVATVARDAASAHEPAAGDRIGPYAVIRPLAAGGMGSVFLAARADEQFRQQVAIKVIRSGFTQSELLTRFKAERQILANLRHANIAHLLDGGVTQTGFPYLVMEYIDGKPIDAFCREKQLTTDERLRLFQTVCSAVQFAHQNLIIHRDIKPANILVTAEGTPKLLDFGIAKIVKPELAGHTVAVTTAAERLMTPEYASPEQILGAPVTTATDVYALGVLLYELLTERKPFQLSATTALEIERVICHQDAPATGLNQDLDNIVRMAIRKEPERRYASVADFSEDIRRYLDGFPVVARKDTFRYRAGKFVQRHPFGVAAGALFFAVVVSFAFGMTILAARAARERDVALAERRTAEQVSAFLTDLFEIADPEKARGDSIPAREILDKAADRIANLRGEPAVQAKLLQTLGKVYENLGLWDKSRAQLAQALAIERQMLGSRHLVVAQRLKDLAELTRRKRDYAAAESMARESLDIRRALVGTPSADVAESLNTLALTLHQKGDLSSPEPLFLEALSMRQLLGPKEHLETAILSNLGGLLVDRGEPARAETYLRECVEIRRRTLNEHHPRLALALAKLAGVLHQLKRYDEAETLLRESLAIREKVYGERHPDTAAALDGLGALLRDRGQFDDAERMHQNALRIRRALFPPGSAEAAQTVSKLAALRAARKQPAEAEELYRQSLRDLRKALAAGHPGLVEPLLGLGSLLAREGRRAEAEPLWKEAVEIRRRTLPVGHWQIAEAEELLGKP